MAVEAGSRIICRLVRKGDSPREAAGAEGGAGQEVGGRRGRRMLFWDSPGEGVVVAIHCDGMHPTARRGLAWPPLSWGFVGNVREAGGRGGMWVGGCRGQTLSGLALIRGSPHPALATSRSCGSLRSTSRATLSRRARGLAWIGMRAQGFCVVARLGVRKGKGAGGFEDPRINAGGWIGSLRWDGVLVGGAPRRSMSGRSFIRGNPLAVLRRKSRRAGEQ